MPKGKNEFRDAVKAMFKKVIAENKREKDGTATKERVAAAMEVMMEPGAFVPEVAAVLEQMLGRESYYDSKQAMFDEALDRLYPREPSDSDDSSDDTIEVDMESDETIVVDLD